VSEDAGKDAARAQATTRGRLKTNFNSAKLNSDPDAIGMNHKTSEIRTNSQI
jgi:hypothetical protein